MDRNVYDTLFSGRTPLAPIFFSCGAAKNRAVFRNLENTGESMENLMKIHYLLKEHPDLALLVQTSPAFCCPSLVTEAMARTIEKKTGVPIVSLTYDGPGGSKNEAVIPFLKFGGRRRL